MSVAVIHAPTHTQMMNVNGTEISGTTTPGIDEELHETTEETRNVELNDIPRAKPDETLYSKEELIAFKESSLTKSRPLCLSEKYCNRDGIWDPELWHYSAESEKRSASPIDSKKKLLLDGIVLSPQGRSFARGCQVTSDKAPGGKQGRNGEKQERDGRNKMSGRLGRGWDAREKSGSQRGRVSPSGDTRFERNTRSDGPGRNRRRAGSYESQPEWFTHGPSSQLDTIELRGFEEGDKKDNKRKKRKKDIQEGNSNQRRLSADDMFDESKKFDINEFFDMAENVLPISGMFENQMTSRFSQWFHNERRSRSGSLNASHNNSQSNSRRSSIADELAEIAGLTLSSPVHTPTPDPDFMFTPIVAAAESCRDDALLDLLQESEIDVQPLLDSVIPHKTVKGAVNLEDLESEEKKTCDEPEEQKRDIEEEQEESTQAFMKFVETMKASGNLPAKPTPTIPDIPPHLLPRPPSSKEKSRSVSPNLTRSRSPSPLQLLQEAIRRAQSPVGLVSNVHVPVTHPPLMSSFDAFRSASPVADMFSAVNATRPLTPEELYGVPPVFNINAARGSDLFEFTGSATNIGAKPGGNRNQNAPRYTTKTEADMADISSVGVSMHNSGSKSTNAGYPVISQAFVPTSVLRKIHSDKHDHKPMEVKEIKKESKEDAPSKSLHSDPVSPQRQPLFDVPQSTSSLKPSTSNSSQSFSSSGRANLMSPSEFLSPKSTRASRSEPRAQPELLTPHRLPLPGSPTSMSPQRLPLPQSPFIQNTPNHSTNASPMTTKQRLLTPRSLPLPQSPLVNQLTATTASNGPSDFGIRPLPKEAGMNDTSRARVRAPSFQDTFKRPLDQSTRHNISGTNMRRFPQGPLPFRGQVPITPAMMRRPIQPGLVPSPYNMNAAANLGRTMNVHPTALALALRNQQYQMARAAAVAVATAAVNRTPMMSPAQAAAAALMLNQQRASASAAALHGLIPQVSPRMFQQPPLRPNLPPALQHRHHVVHRSDSSKESSLSKWFSDAVLNQSQSQAAAPGRGAKVLSVEELERHA